MIGRIDFKSAGATRQRGGAPAPYSPEAVDAAMAASKRAGRRIGWKSIGGLGAMISDCHRSG